MYVRSDFTIDCNKRQSSIAVSVYYPIKKEVGRTLIQEILGREGEFVRNFDHRQDYDLKQMPCIMYLHSQGACRLEGRFLIERCAQEGIALCLFDFLGSGVSSGEYVSLGLFEQLQVEQVINFITDKFKIGAVGIWGRSMGAVTALLYAENNSFRISGMVRRENNTRCSTVHLVH